MVTKMYKYVLINKETNIVENKILWDGGDSWSPPDTQFAIKMENMDADIGYTYDNGTFIASGPVAPTSTPTPTLAELQAQLVTLTAQMQALANTQ